MSAWSWVKKTAGKVADFTPGVSNIKGAIEGDLTQTLLGPAVEIPGVRKIGDKLDGVASENAANAASGVQQQNSAMAQWLATEQRNNANALTGNALSYFNPATQAYNNLYAQPHAYAPGTQGYGTSSPAGSLTTPGYGEQAWQQVSGMGGTAYQPAPQGTRITPSFAGQFTQAGQNPYTSGPMTYMPPAPAQSAPQVPGLLSQTNSQAWMNQMAPQLAGPSASEQFFNPAAYQKTTNAENFYNQNAASYDTNTMNQAYAGLVSGLQNSPMANSYQGFVGSLNGGPLASSYQGLMGSLDGGPMASSWQGYVNSLQGGPMADSYQGFVNSLNGGAMSQSQPQLDALLAQNGNTQNMFQNEGFKYDTNSMQDLWNNSLQFDLDPSQSKLNQSYGDIYQGLGADTVQEQQAYAIRQQLNMSNQINQILPDVNMVANRDLADRQNQGNSIIGQEQQPSSTQLASGQIGGIYNSVLGQEQGPSFTGQQYGNLLGTYGNLMGQEQQMGATGQEYGNIRGAYGGPGMFEQFVQNASSGSDPYFAMLQRDQDENLNAQMNARGGYNSGAAIQALGRQNSDLEAKKYAQMAALTQGAQGMQLQRASGLQGLAGQAETEAQQRMLAQSKLAQNIQGLTGQTENELQTRLQGQAAMGQNLQGLAGQTEGEIQQRLMAQNAIGQQLYGNQFDLSNARVNWAGQAGAETRDIQNSIVNQSANIDSARLARLQGMTSLGSATDASTLQFLQQQAEAANMASTQSLNSLNSKFGAANMADTQNLNRITERGNLANMADTAQLNRVMGQSSITNQADQAQMNRTMGQANITNMADTSQLNRTMGQANIAGMADTAQLNRVNSQANITNQADTAMYNRLMGQGTLANQTAGMNLNYLNSKGQAAGAADTSYLNLLQGGQQAANSASQAQLARIMGGGTLANTADSNNRANTVSYLNAANQAQGLAESRQQSAFTNAMALGSTQAGLTMQGGQMGMSEYDKWLENSMGFKSNSAQIDLANANAQSQLYMNMAKTGLGYALGGPAGGYVAQQIPLGQTVSPDAGASMNLGNQYQNLYVDPMFQGQNPYSQPGVGMVGW